MQSLRIQRTDCTISFLLSRFLSQKWHWFDINVNVFASWVHDGLHVVSMFYSVFRLCVMTSFTMNNRSCWGILNIDFCSSRLSLFPSERKWYWKRQYHTCKVQSRPSHFIKQQILTFCGFLMWLDCQIGFLTMRMKRLSLKFQTTYIYWIFTVC